MAHSISQSASRHNPFGGWPLFLGLALSALILAVATLSHAPPENNLWIRFDGLSTNSVGGWDCTVVVPKPERYDAVLFWSLRFEETNKTSVAASNIVQTPANPDRACGPHEEGIVACGYGLPWDTGKVYRVIGYYQPGNAGLRARLYGWTARVPALRRLLPQPPSVAVTSHWSEVTALQNPF